MSIPYFAFYPKDWLADTGHLSYEERGVYFDLLCHMWVRADESCSLPDDDQFLANLLHVPLVKWRKLRATLITGPAPVLVANGGQVTNKRLAQEFAIAQQKSAKATHSARVRWQPSDPAVEPVPEHSQRNANGYAMGYADALPTVCYPDTDKDKDLDLDHPPLDPRSIPAPTAPACEEPKPPDQQTATISVDNFTPFRDRCWEAYPTRNGKRLHKPEFTRRLKAIPSRQWDDVETAIANYAASGQARRGYAEDPHRFLTHWQDWTEPEQPEPQRNGSTSHAATQRQPDKLTGKLSGTADFLNGLDDESLEGAGGHRHPNVALLRARATA